MNSNLDPIDRQAIRRERKRLQEQAAIFMRMGFSVDDLAIFVDRRCPVFAVDVVPKIMVKELGG